MNKSITWLILSIVYSLLSPGCLYGQTDEELQELIFDRIGGQFELNEDSPIYENFLENFRNPVNLNTADYDQLQGLLILSDFQIVQLLDHINEFGSLFSEYELQSIPGFDKKSISNLLLFAYIDETITRTDSWKGYLLGRTNLLLQKKKGFETTDTHQKFAGSPLSTLVKIRVQKPGQYAFGLTFENDAGEPFKWEPENQWFGASFTSGFFEYKSRNILNKVIIGDFQANWGQGLVFGGGFSTGKGRYTTSSQKHISSGLIPYRSTAEQGYMRGIGITIGKKSLQISTLLSGLGIDANLNEYGNISSRYLSGLFRNEGESSKRATCYEKTAGLNLHFKGLSRNLLLGLSAVYTQFDKAFDPVSRPENRYAFTGKSNVLTGTYFEYRKKNYVFFGEGAGNDARKTGYILGTLASLSDHLETLLTIRNYSPGFNSFYSNNVLSESSSARNENGIYWGLKFTQSKKMSLSAYADFYKSKWLKRSISSPSEGTDYLFDIVYFPSDKLELKALYTVEGKTLNAPKELSVDHNSIGQRKKTLKLDLKIRVSEKLSYCTGIWSNRYLISNIINKGSLIYSGISFKSKSTSLNFRSIITDSRDYSTRFYMYEPDVLYAFSVPVYYGQNIRYLFLIKQKFTSKLSCWLKLSGTFFRDRIEIGTGNDQTKGAVKSELKFQTVYKL